MLSGEIALKNNNNYIISSFRIVFRELHTFGPCIEIHISFFGCSYIKLLENCSSLSIVHKANLMYKQILNIFWQ